MRSSRLIASAAILTGSAVVMQPLPDDGVSRAVAEVERPNDLLESLAQKFEASPAATRERFAEVCQPVGVEAEKLATQTGWKVRTLDRAYNFEVGDLRGVYSVFVPDPR